jgi:hypothetical protein
MIKLRISIESANPQYLDIVDVLRPAFDEWSEMFSSYDNEFGKPVHVYDIDNTTTNLQLATALLIQYPNIRACVEDNGMSEEELAKI